MGGLVKKRKYGKKGDLLFKVTKPKKDKDSSPERKNAEGDKSSESKNNVLSEEVLIK